MHLASLLVSVLGHSIARVGGGTRHGGAAAAAAADVLVVGAGQAGMAAAHQLTRFGRSVLVLEATDHVGGRTRNVDAATGVFDADTDDAVEVGGTWLSPGHTAALQLCRDLGVEVYNASFVDGGGAAEAEVVQDWPWWFWGSDYPHDQEARLGRSVFHTSAGRATFRTPREFLASLSPRTVRELNRSGSILVLAMSKLSKQCWDVDTVSKGWVQLDADSTMSALGKDIQDAEALQILRNCVHNKNAHEPEAVSLLYSTLSWLGCNSDGPDNQFRVRGGTQAIPLRIARALGGRVLLSTVVRSISAAASGVVLVAEDGREFRASAVIVTGSPSALLGIRFSPPLPGAQAQVLQRMPMGTSLKLAAIYQDGPWWRSQGLQGDILAVSLPPELSLPEPDSAIPLFVQCVDHSPYSQRLGVIVCFVEGRQNLYFTSLPRVAQERLFLAFLRSSFEHPRADTPRPTIVLHNWADEEFARGAYSGFFPPGVLSVPEYWAAWREMEKLPNAFFAGADYHVGYGNGYIEGAIRDGQLAASRVHSRLRTQWMGM